LLSCSSPCKACSTRSFTCVLGIIAFVNIFQRSHGGFLGDKLYWQEEPQQKLQQLSRGRRIHIRYQVDKQWMSEGKAKMGREMEPNANYTMIGSSLLLTPSSLIRDSNVRS
jgi:hypothetical protein